jgi:hypothetical protein
MGDLTVYGFSRFSQAMVDSTTPTSTVIGANQQAALTQRVGAAAHAVARVAN